MRDTYRLPPADTATRPTAWLPQCTPQEVATARAAAQASLEACSRRLGVPVSCGRPVLIRYGAIIQARRTNQRERARDTSYNVEQDWGIGGSLSCVPSAAP